MSIDPQIYYHLQKAGAFIFLHPLQNDVFGLAVS